MSNNAYVLKYEVVAKLNSTICLPRPQSTKKETTLEGSTDVHTYYGYVYLYARQCTLMKNKDWTVSI